MTIHTNQCLIGTNLKCGKYFKIKFYWDLPSFDTFRITDQFANKTIFKVFSIPSAVSSIIYMWISYQRILKVSKDHFISDFGLKMKYHFMTNINFFPPLKVLKIFYWIIFFSGFGSRHIFDWTLSCSSFQMSDFLSLSICLSLTLSSSFFFPFFLSVFSLSLSFTI